VVSVILHSLVGTLVGYTGEPDELYEVDKRRL
jgi:hypothetical protein